LGNSWEIVETFICELLIRNQQVEGPIRFALTKPTIHVGLRALDISFCKRPRNNPVRAAPQFAIQTRTSIRQSLNIRMKVHSHQNPAAA
jgi:hypothetical protein